MGVFNCPSRNCTTPGPVIKANADVAGAGVIYSFIVNVWVAIGLTILTTFVDIGDNGKLKGRFLSVRKIAASLLLGASDAQCFLAIALILATYVHHCDLTVYHYNLIVNMLILTQVTITLTMTCQAAYLRRSWFNLFRLIPIAFVCVGFIMIASYGSSMPAGFEDGINWSTSCYFPPSGDDVPDLPKPLPATHNVYYIGFVIVGVSDFLIVLCYFPWLRRKIDHLRVSYACRVAIQGPLPFGLAVVFTNLLLEEWRYVKYHDGDYPDDPNRLRLETAEQDDWVLDKLCL